MYYFKLVTLKFDFKMDVPNQPKSFKFPKRSLAVKKLNTGHLPHNGSKVTRGFTMKRKTALICY